MEVQYTIGKRPLCWPDQTAIRGQQLLSNFGHHLFFLCISGALPDVLQNVTYKFQPFEGMGGEQGQCQECDIRIVSRAGDTACISTGMDAANFGVLFQQLLYKLHLSRTES